MELEDSKLEDSKLEDSKLEDSKRKTVIKIGSYFMVVFLSLLFLYVGNKIAVKNLTIFDNLETLETVEAIVREIMDISEDEYLMSDGTLVKNTEITFAVRITKGSHKDETITARQSLSSFFGSTVKEVAEGDRVLLVTDSGAEWYFMDYLRIYKLIGLGAVLMVLLLLFGRMKGFNAILSLCLTCVSIFAVFIPSLLAGQNIYVWAVAICVYSIVTTLFIVIGINRKSISAIAGCFAGLFITGILTILMDKILGLTGVVNQEAQFLLYLPTEKPIDLRAIIFAAIIIGAVGAIMDVAMSISSALWEIRMKAVDNTFKSLFESGLSIGRDVMGTMMNTLVLAYIGSSLSTVLLLSVNTVSFADLVNREMIIVEILQAIAGTFGIFLTMPLTSLICAALYSRSSAETLNAAQTDE